MTPSDNIFLKIASHEIPAKIVYEDERVVAFQDINPAAPVHVLIVRAPTPSRRSTTSRPSTRTWSATCSSSRKRSRRKTHRRRRLPLRDQLQRGGRPERLPASPARIGRPADGLAPGLSRGMQWAWRCISRRLAAGNGALSGRAGIDIVGWRGTARAWEPIRERLAQVRPHRHARQRVGPRAGRGRGASRRGPRRRHRNRRRAHARRRRPGHTRQSHRKQSDFRQGNRRRAAGALDRHGGPQPQGPARRTARGARAGGRCRTRFAAGRVGSARRGKSLDNAPRGATVATGSLRRAAQLLGLRPDLNIVPLRGNVPTRLKKNRGGRGVRHRAGRRRLARLGLSPRTSCMNCRPT